MRTALLALAASLPLLTGCPAPAPSAGPAAADPALAVAAPLRDDTTSFPAWSRSAVIYEINVRQYTPEGTFAALERHLPRLDSLGVDILWLMPVQPIGVLNRKGSLGSYYSIRDYTAINPEFGTEADFRRFVDAAHRLGMRVILDWVANHSAHDHPWAAEHPDWHDRRPDGTTMNARDNEGRETDWTDVAELNFNSAAMRRAMIGEMAWWVTEMGIDGFRADVAGGVPMDFWRQANQALLALRPDLFLLAEAENPGMHTAFHATYGWELHHLLNDITQGEKTTAELDAYFERQSAAYGRGAFRMYFTSNHDENSWQGTEFERMAANHLPAFVLSATVMNSFPLLYTGQEASLNKRLRFFEKDTVDWSGPSLADFYRRMFELKERNPALWNGPWGGEQRALRTDGGERVYAYTRTRGDNTVLVAVNFGPAAKSVGYQSLAQPGTYRDWFGGQSLALEASGRLEIPAHGYRVLVRER